ncbi:MAG: pyruvate ferredoxin oxidoreductase [Candidatus Helarchaeota archaeon]|nr:pyruvate ferredoxin oxidoreductase [Candidatus Helarchaeota archaeon]
MTKVKSDLKQEIRIISGNATVAWAARYARVQVISAYPITPQTVIVEKLSDFVDAGEMDAEYVRVESEHSVMGFLVGASYAGARTFTATAGQGLLYMTEMLHWASAARLPIVTAISDRGIAPPWNIWGDHQDVIAERDSGWLILFASNHQEIFDTIIQAYKIAEDSRVFLPIMVCLEGFMLSHMNTLVDMPDQKEIDDFLPEIPKNGWPHIFLDPERPISHGNLQNPGGAVATPGSMYFEFRSLIDEAMINSKTVIKEVAEDFKKKFGRYHGALIEEYKCDDAEVALVCMGNLADQAKYSVEKMRDEGYKVGTVKLRSYKPFPIEDFQNLAKKIKVFAILERNMGFSLYGGCASVDLKSALYYLKERPLVMPVIGGVGGRDVSVDDQCWIIKQAFKNLEKGELENKVEYVGFHK